MNNARRSRKGKLLIRALIPVGVTLLALLLILKFGASIWLNGQRAQLEKAITVATGLKTSIKGTVSVTLFPTPGISLGGITMEQAGKTVLAAANLESNFDLLPLLKWKLIPHAIDINRLWLQLPADAQGRPVLPVLAPERITPTKSLPFGLQTHLPDRLELRNSTVIVQSANGEELHAIKGLNLAAHPVRSKALLQQSATDSSRSDLEVAVYVNFTTAKFDKLKLGPAQIQAHYRAGGITADVDEASVFDGKASARLSWQPGGAKPRYTASLVLKDFDASQSVTLFRQKPFIRGRLNLSAEVSGEGASIRDMLGSADGTVKLEGANLELTSTNLDELVTRIISSQQYNLVDAMAYFFIGPFGASATKGLDIASVARELSKPGTTPNEIKRIHTSWKLTDGVASAEDVALETSRYLLALKGRVKLVKREFENIQIAVVNNRGCPVAVQKLHGPIASPSMEKTNIMLTLTRPMLDALSKSAKQLLDANCETPFYQGELLPPSPAGQGSAQEKSEQASTGE